MFKGAVGLEHAEAALGCIFHLQLAQHPLQGEQLALAAGSPEAKPAQQHQPQAPHAGPAQQQHHPQADRGQGEKAARGGGHLGAFALAAAELPHQRFEDQPPIERQARQQVEQRQDQVEAAQLVHHRAQQRRGMGGAVTSRQQQTRQDQAHQRSGRRHHQRTECGGALPLHAGHAPQQKQGDAAHLHALLQRHQRVAEFMQQHRHEQQHGGEQSQPPELEAAAVSAQLLAVLLLEGHRGQAQDHEPAGMDAQGNAADLQQLPALAHAVLPNGSILERPRCCGRLPCC